jgi:hypothetical protein
MERLIFGDNQFFGINHMSEEKARAQAIRFQSDAAVIAVLDSALEEGVHAFTCTTHDRIERIADHVRTHPERYRNFHFYPGMPYAHKYANAVTEDGMLGALGRFMPGEGGGARLMRGGLSLARGDVEGIATFLVDAEMAMFAGLSTPVIFLQNVLIDLLLGLGAHDAFRIFDAHVRVRYGAEPGYMTMNMPHLLPVLDRLGIDNPIVCTNINKRGFRMSGGIEAYTRALERHRFRCVAMSVFASGAIPPEEAIDWVCRQPNIESIVFGASSRANIRATRTLVARHWALDEAEIAAVA